MKKEQYLDTEFGTTAAPISKEVSEAIEKGTIRLDSEEDLNKFIKGVQNIQENALGRAASLNLLNINNSKNTIEFRMANGTINPDTWVENVRLFGRIVQVSEKLAQIEKKKELTQEDRKLMQLKENLKIEKIDNEKIETFLELLFTEEERLVYRERYNENSRLIKEAEKNLPETAESVAFKKGEHKICEYGDIANKGTLGNCQQVTDETRQGVKGKETKKGVKGEATTERGENNG